ncbi:ATPase [Planctomyces bekefii]|uniref:ATPase n=1 Tax=Planctomyces bekefii TaxID=1653850 RepID=A0A5C6M4X5_9PLAN|nr:ATPase [Planctomyces bekefii]
MFNRLINPIISYSFFLFGARGTGKTTFLTHFFRERNPFWINLLEPAEEDLFLRKPDELSARLENVRAGTWVVIDEVQKAPKLLNIVHHLIETKKLKFALTGSSARRLKQKGVNLLAGRAFTNYAFPLTHVELENAFSLIDVLQWGTLPKVFELTEPEARNAYLRSYSLNYVTTEIQAEQWVRKIEPFRKFLPIAAQMNGKILNYAKIAREVGVDTTTIISYFDILEDTLLGFRLDAFHESLRKRQTLKPKFYFFDLGLKRALEQTLTVPLLPQTFAFGSAFEHFVICEVMRLNAYYARDFSFSYLRTKDNVELDLIIDRPGRSRVFLEIKSSESVGREDSRSLDALTKGLDVKALLISRDPNRKKMGHVDCLHWQEGISEIFSS